MSLGLPATRHVFWPVEFGNITGDKMPLVSIVQDDKELSSTYGKEKLPTSFNDMVSLLKFLGVVR